MKRANAFQTQREASTQVHRAVHYYPEDQTVSLRVSFTTELDRIHNVFYVSMLRRYIGRPDQEVIPDEVDLDPDLTFLQRLISIIDNQIRQLRNKQIPILKVLWRNQESKSAT